MITMFLILDPMGFGTDEEEAQEIRQRIERIVGPVEILGFSNSPLAIMGYEPDLLVLDYGGIATMGAWDTAERNIQFLCQFAKDHPKTLLVIWTWYTYKVYHEELEAQFGHLDNIVCMYSSPDEAYDFENGDKRAKAAIVNWIARKRPEQI